MKKLRRKEIRRERENPEKGKSGCSCEINMALLSFKTNLKLEMDKEYEESQIPEWKKPLIKLHARRKSENSEKEEMERKRVEEEEKRFKALPAWKQQLILKKKSKGLDNDQGKGQRRNSDVSNELEVAKIENLAEFGKESADINDQVEGVNNNEEINENDWQTEMDDGTDEMNGDVEVEVEEEGKDNQKDEETGEVSDEEQNQEENKDEEAAAVETDAEKDEDTAAEKDDYNEADDIKNEDEEKKTGAKENEESDVEKNKIKKEDDVSKSDNEQ